MLMEGHVDYEIVTDADDLTRFDAVILTGGGCLDDAESFLNFRGKLLILGESVFARSRTQLLFEIGGEFQGAARFKTDYLVVGRELKQDLPDAPFLNYDAALRITPTTGRVLARIHEPYFDRTYGHYCSHQNTPYQPEPSSHAGGLRKGRIIYLPHALGKMYYEHGARVHRKFFLNALRKLHQRPVLTLNGLPSAGRMNLLHQPRENRYALHLLYAPPLQRGRCLVIEDMPEVRDVEITLRVPQQIQRVELPLHRRRLTMKRTSGVVRVTLPRFSAHDVVTFRY
jgi:hypothetical protein